MKRSVCLLYGRGKKRSHKPYYVRASLIIIVVKEKIPCRRQLIRIESMVSIEGRLIIVGLMYQH